VFFGGSDQSRVHGSDWIRLDQRRHRLRPPRSHLRGPNVRAVTNTKGAELSAGDVTYPLCIYGGLQTALKGCCESEKIVAKVRLRRKQKCDTSDTQSSDK